MFEYQPEDHTLPDEHVLLHVTRNSLKPFLPLDEAPVFTIEIRSKGFELNDRDFMFALAQTMPTYGTINGVYREGTVIAWSVRALSDRHHLTETSSSRSSSSHILDRVPEHLEFYLFAVENLPSKE